MTRPRRASQGGDERRQNRTLREALDDVVNHVRDIARRAPQMNAAELDYAQERLEWMTDELWRIAVEGEGTGE